jgi:RNA polymerase-associated protein LEO1
MVKGEKRSEMMLNLFGDNSEEEEIESEHECNRRQPNYASVTLSIFISFVSSLLIVSVFVFFTATVLQLHLGIRMVSGVLLA